MVDTPVLRRGQISTSAINAALEALASAINDELLITEVQEAIEDAQDAVEALGAALAGATAASYTVATLPDAENNARKIVYVTDGADGEKCLAVSDGEKWLRVAIGAEVSAE